MKEAQASLQNLLEIIRERWIKKERFDSVTTAFLGQCNISWWVKQIIQSIHLTAYHVFVWLLFISVRSDATNFPMDGFSKVSASYLLFSHLQRHLKSNTWGSPSTLLCDKIVLEAGCLMHTAITHLELLLARSPVSFSPGLFPMYAQLEAEHICCSQILLWDCF